MPALTPVTPIRSWTSISGVPATKSESTLTVPPEGGVSMVIVGAAESTTNVTGSGAAFPAASVTVTLTLCGPSVNASGTVASVAGSAPRVPLATSTPPSVTTQASPVVPPATLQVTVTGDETIVPDDGVQPKTVGATRSTVRSSDTGAAALPPASGAPAGMVQVAPSAPVAAALAAPAATPSAAASVVPSVQETSTAPALPSWMASAVTTTSTWKPGRGSASKALWPMKLPCDTGTLTARTGAAVSSSTCLSTERPAPPPQSAWIE